VTPEAGEDDLPEEDRELISSDSSPFALQDTIAKKDFAAWHHPVKQIVRESQWGNEIRQLIEKRQFSERTIRYFTLPGPDLFDVHMLANVCAPSSLIIDYFGFLAGGVSGQDMDGEGRRVPWAVAEAALRQSGKITAGSEIASDRLEDIAVDRSKARTSLIRKPPFDIINIDGCGFLAHKPENRNKCTFDALRILLQHQSRAQSPWLLLLTTRADAVTLGEPGAHIQKAILDNLTSWPDIFGTQLASTMQWPSDKITASVSAAWNALGMPFMQIFTLGVAKFLLHHFHRDSALQANVELKSSYVYRVYGSEVDMAALAFLISPDPAAITGAVSPEPKRACDIVKRLPKVWDIDDAIRTDAALRQKAVSGMEALLKAANYDIARWRSWVADHKTRPLPIA
jgi:hypothetical protein